MYRFKISPHKMELNPKNKSYLPITLELIDENNSKLEYNIENLDTEKDNYLYDVFFEENEGWTCISTMQKYINVHLLIYVI